MKKHGIIIDITNNAIAFWIGHCIYTRASLSIILNQATLPTEVTLIKTI